MTRCPNILQDLVQIVTNDFETELREVDANSNQRFETELREENHWLLFAPIPVEPKNCVDYESGLRNARASCNGEL